MREKVGCEVPRGDENRDTTGAQIPDGVQESSGESVFARGSPHGNWNGNGIHVPEPAQIVGERQGRFDP